MSTKLRISVTKEILEKSKMCGTDSGKLISMNCAVALAVIDIFPRSCVSTSNIAVFHIGLGVTLISLPEAACRFIDNFDKLSAEDRVKMEPISFEIEIPDEVINQINIDEIRPLLVNHPTLELVEV
jgi:hypothetical protein